MPQTPPHLKKEEVLKLSLPAKWHEASHEAMEIDKGSF